MSSARKHALLIIDMSQEQLFPDGKPILPDWNRYANILSLAKLLPKERVLDSRLWIEESDHSSLAKLYDVGKANTEGAKLAANLKDLKATFVKKIQYSAFFGSQLNEVLKAQGVNTILLAGINTDYCVFASALDAFYLGFEVWLIKDACGSIGGTTAHKQGIAEFNKFLVNRGRVLTTEEALKQLA